MATHGLPMGYSWAIHGLPMGYPWATHGLTPRATLWLPVENL